MIEPTCLEAEHIIDIQAELTAFFCGSVGIGSGSVLVAMVQELRNHSAANDTDFASLAAAHAVGLARNHPFIDGNKRAAFAALMVFLRLNGVAFAPQPEEATAIILALAAGEIDEAGLTRWIRDNWPAGPA